MQNQNWRFFSNAIAVAAVAVLVVTFSTFAAAQKLPGSREAVPEAAPAGPHSFFVPESSIERPEDAGIRAHTNWVFATKDGRVIETAAQPDFTAVQQYETPSSMGCLYKIPGSTGPCVPNINSPGGPQKGGQKVIVLVDAYDNPYAAAELAAFDAQFGLPAVNFIQDYANGSGSSCAGSPPPFNAGWGLEESTDIEWAHVMAPDATIVLMEACSSSYTDLLIAEYDAGALAVGTYGGGNISNSWGSGEFSGETAYDVYFGPYWWEQVVYSASAGDAGCGAAYPSSSPWVVSAGGTSVYRKSTTLGFDYEGCWSGSGGGTSAYETYSSSYTTSNTGEWAAYQWDIFGSAARSTPDMAFNADPNSGVVVYDCAYASGTCYFYQVGGTSVASPSLAGIMNNADNQLGNGHINIATGTGYHTAEEDNFLYSQLGTVTDYPKNFYDITKGSNGCTVGKQWDFCTGVGSPRGLLGK